MAIYSQPDYQNERRKTMFDALSQIASLALKNKQINSEGQYYKNMGAYYGAAGKQQEFINQMLEEKRRQAVFGGGQLAQPPIGAVPPSFPAPGQLTPEQLLAANQANGITQPSSPQDMILKSMTVDPISQTMSQTYGQSPQAESDMQVKTQLRKDVLGRMGKLQELIPLLDNFEAQLESVPVSSGMAGKAQGVQAYLEGVSNADPFAAANISQIDALRPQIARAFGDVGNLSDSEQKTAAKFMPGVTDSADTRAVKIVSGLTFLKRKLEQNAKDAGLLKDPEYQQKFSMLNTRIMKALGKALESGANPDKLTKFAGKDILDSIGVRKFKSIGDAESQTEVLNNGDVVMIDGRLARWEE